MNRIPLASYLKHHSQQSVAEAVGLSQGAISKMVRTGRNISVVEHDTGFIELVEEKPITGRPTVLNKTQGGQHVQRPNPSA